MDQNSLSLPKLTHSHSACLPNSLTPTRLRQLWQIRAKEEKTQLLLYLVVADPTMGFDSCMLLGFDRGYWTWVFIVHAPLFNCDKNPFYVFNNTLAQHGDGKGLREVELDSISSIIIATH